MDLRDRPVVCRRALNKGNVGNDYGRFYLLEQRIYGNAHR